MGDYSKIEQFLDQYLLDNGIITSSRAEQIPSIEKSQYFSERSGNDRPIAAKSAAKNRIEEKHFKII